MFRAIDKLAPPDRGSPSRSVWELRRAPVPSWMLQCYCTRCGSESRGPATLSIAHARMFLVFALALTYSMKPIRLLHAEVHLDQFDCFTEDFRPNILLAIHVSRLKRTSKIVFGSVIALFVLL